MRDLKVGDVVVVRGSGVFSGTGVPVNCEGKKAKVEKVGRTLLTVLIDGESFSRKIYFREVKRRAERKN